MDPLFEQDAKPNFSVDSIGRFYDAINATIASMLLRDGEYSCSTDECIPRADELEAEPSNLLVGGGREGGLLAGLFSGVLALTVSTLLSSAR